jgi:hypothetical protein
VARATRVFRERSGLNHLRQVDSPAINIPLQSAPYLVFGYLAHSTHHSAFIIQHSAFSISISSFLPDWRERAGGRCRKPHPPTRRHQE